MPQWTMSSRESFSGPSHLLSQPRSRPAMQPSSRPWLRRRTTPGQPRQPFATAIWSFVTPWFLRLRILQIWSGWQHFLLHLPVAQTPCQVPLVASPSWPRPHNRPLSDFLDVSRSHSSVSWTDSCLTAFPACKSVNFGCFEEQQLSLTNRFLSDGRFGLQVGYWFFLNVLESDNSSVRRTDSIWSVI